MYIIDSWQLKADSFGVDQHTRQNCQLSIVNCQLPYLMEVRI